MSADEGARPARALRRLTKERRAAMRRELYELAAAGALDLRDALRRMRKIAGRTQIEYARLVGVTPRVLIEFERGIGNPTLRTLEKLFAPFSLELTLRVRERRDNLG